MTENRKHTQHTLAVYIKTVDLFSDMQEHMTHAYPCNYLKVKDMHTQK